MTTLALARIGEARIQRLLRFFRFLLMLPIVFATTNSEVLSALGFGTAKYEKSSQPRK